MALYLSRRAPGEAVPAAVTMAGLSLMGARVLHLGLVHVGRGTATGMSRRSLAPGVLGLARALNPLSSKLPGLQLRYVVPSLLSTPREANIELTAAECCSRKDKYIRFSQFAPAITRYSHPVVGGVPSRMCALPEKWWGRKKTTPRPLSSATPRMPRASPPQHLLTVTPCTPDLSPKRHEQRGPPSGLDRGEPHTLNPDRTGPRQTDKQQRPAKRGACGWAFARPTSGFAYRPERSQALDLFFWLTRKEGPVAQSAEPE